MAVNGGRGSGGLGVGMAVTGLALAAAVVVAAVALGASLHGLVTTPSRYGAPWDVSLRANGVLGMGELADDVAALPGVGAASTLLGLDFELDGESTWTIALEPIPGIPTAIAPMLTEGRAPTRPDEIAVGALTQQSIGKRVGDRVLLTTDQSLTTPTELTIVGTVVMNAIDEGSPGLGAVVAPALMHELAPEEVGDAIVVDLADGADGEAARSVMEHDLAVNGIELDPPRRQTAIRDVERIRSLPGLLAGVVALLAAACLAHALATSVRRNRAELAVFKALGFTPRQVSAAVAWEACALAVVALLIGVPAGLALATWGWRAVADRLGLESPTIVPIAQVAVVALALIAVGQRGGDLAGSARRSAPARSRTPGRVAGPGPAAAPLADGPQAGRLAPTSAASMAAGARMVSSTITAAPRCRLRRRAGSGRCGADRSPAGASGGRRPRGWRPAAARRRRRRRRRSTMTAGLSMLTQAASTPPMACPAWRTRRTASGWPGEHLLDDVPAVERVEPELSEAAASALPPAIASRHPTFPQRHTTSSWSGTWTWPMSPAAPSAPRCT